MIDDQLLVVLGDERSTADGYGQKTSLEQFLLRNGHCGLSVAKYHHRQFSRLLVEMVRVIILNKRLAMTLDYKSSETCNAVSFPLMECYALVDSRWDFVGSTMVTNNYIRLTPDHQSRRGAIWNTIVSIAQKHCTQAS